MKSKVIKRNYILLFNYSSQCVPSLSQILFYLCILCAIFECASNMGSLLTEFIYVFLCFIPSKPNASVSECALLFFLLGNSTARLTSTATRVDFVDHRDGLIATVVGVASAGAIT